MIPTKTKNDIVKLFFAHFEDKHKAQQFLGEWISLLSKKYTWTSHLKELKVHMDDVIKKNKKV